MAMEELGGISAAIEFQDQYSEQVAKAIQALGRLQDAVEKFQSGLSASASGIEAFGQAAAALGRGMEGIINASRAMADSAKAFSGHEIRALEALSKMAGPLGNAEAKFTAMQGDADRIAASMAAAAASADAAASAALKAPGMPGGIVPPGGEQFIARGPRERPGPSEPVGTAGALVSGAADVYFKWTIASLMARGAVSGVMGFLDAGGQVTDIQAALAQQGLTPSQIDQATTGAEHAAVNIPGSTISEALAGFMELRSVLGNNKEALAALPAFLKNTMALAGRGLGGDQDMLHLIKALDVQGAFKNAKGQLDPAKLETALHATVAAMVASQGLLTPAMLMRFVQMAGPGLQSANIEDVLRSYVELLIGIGNRTGRGTGMAYLKLMGGQMTTSQLKAFENLGLINPSDVGGTKGHPFINPDKLLGAAELRQKGLGSWVEDVLFPQILKQYGKLDISTVERAIAQFPVSAQRVLAGFFTMNQQIKRFGGKGGLFDQAIGTDLLAELMKTGWTANVKNLSTAFTSFVQAASLPETVKATNTLKIMADFFRDLTAQELSADATLKKMHDQGGPVLPGWWPLPGNEATHKAGKKTLWDETIGELLGPWFGPGADLKTPGPSVPRNFRRLVGEPEQPADNHVTVTLHAPITVQGPLIGNEEELDMILNNWWEAHSKAITSTIEESLAKIQHQKKRTTFLDWGGPGSRPHEHYGVGKGS